MRKSEHLLLGKTQRAPNVHRPQTPPSPKKQPTPPRKPRRRRKSWYRKKCATRSKKSQNSKHHSNTAAATAHYDATEENEKLMKKKTTITSEKIKHASKTTRKRGIVSATRRAVLPLCLKTANAKATILLKYLIHLIWINMIYSKKRIKTIRKRGMCLSCTASHPSTFSQSDTRLTLAPTLVL